MISIVNLFEQPEYSGEGWLGAKAKKLWHKHKGKVGLATGLVIGRKLAGKGPLVTINRSKKDES